MKSPHHQRPEVVPPPAVLEDLEAVLEIDGLENIQQREASPSQTLSLTLGFP